MPVEADPQTLFERWYIEPLAVLRRIPHGDGGVIALATGCFLYERYATTLIKECDPGQKADEKALVDQLAGDFGLDARTASVFWDVIRNGLLHGAMPKVMNREGTIVRWHFSHQHAQAIGLRVEGNGEEVLEVEPWRFVDRVIALWRERPDLLNASASRPWGAIIY